MTGRSIHDVIDSSEPYRVIPGRRGAKIRLYLKDCLAGLRENVEASSADIVVTSPPYNIGVAYSTHRDRLPREEYLKWMDDLACRVERVLTKRGSFFLNIGNTPKDQSIAWDVAQVMRKRFVLQNVIHWIKSIAISRGDAGNYPNMFGDIAVGHYKPIVSERFLNDCQEYIFHFTKSGDVKLDKLAVGVPYQDKTNVGRWKNAKTDRRDRGNTWFIPYETIQKKSERPHPATFPAKLPEMCVRLHGMKPNTLVVDPFLGIGSSALAALRLGASFVGFEIDKSYLENAIELLLKFAVT